MCLACECMFASSGEPKKPVQQVRKERAHRMEGRQEERGSGMGKGGGVRKK